MSSLCIVFTWFTYKKAKMLAYPGILSAAAGYTFFVAFGYHWFWWHLIFVNPSEIIYFHEVKIKRSVAVLRSPVKNDRKDLSQWYNARERLKPALTAELGKFGVMPLELAFLALIAFSIPSPAMCAGESSVGKLSFSGHIWRFCWEWLQGNPIIK